MYKEFEEIEQLFAFIDDGRRGVRAHHAAFRPKKSTTAHTAI